MSIHEKTWAKRGHKTLIGKAAATLIKDGDTVILDSGTTSREIATNLKSRENVVVMTNGLDVAMELANTSGGSINDRWCIAKKCVVFSGSQAENSLRNYRFDKVF